MKQDYRISEKIGERKASVVCLKTVVSSREENSAIIMAGVVWSAETAPRKLPVLLSRCSTASSLIPAAFLNTSTSLSSTALRIFSFLFIYFLLLEIMVTWWKLSWDDSKKLMHAHCSKYRANHTIRFIRN